MKNMLDNGLPSVTIYTDGSCSGNPGPGGWAAILKQGDRIREIIGGDLGTTSVRMEMTAIVRSLDLLTKPCNVTLYTDCQFVCNAINNHWVDRWRINGFSKQDGESVKNRDLWEKLIRLLDKHHVSFIWVKGHSGDQLNERCDRLAKEQTKARKR